MTDYHIVIYAVDEHWNPTIECYSTVISHEEVKMLLEKIGHEYSVEEWEHRNIGP